MKKGILNLYGQPDRSAIGYREDQKMKKVMLYVLAAMLLWGMLAPAASFATLMCDGAHTWGSWTTVRRPSCTEAGLEERYCRMCMEGREERVIPAAGHTYGDWKVTKEATCTAAGSRERVCTVCQYVQTESIPAKGHSYGDWKITRAASCLEAGSRERVCSACGDRQAESIPKTAEHQFGSWAVTREATCKQDGVRTRTCSVCGKTETESIPKSSAHTYSDWKVTREVTCTQNGTRTRTCSVCGKTETETIQSAGHQYGDWKITREATCKTTGKKEQRCSVCGDTRYRTIEKTGHTPGEWEITKEATSRSKGHRKTRCTVCGKKMEEDFYPEGTLYKGGDCSAEDVRALQAALLSLGLYKGKLSGDFDSATLSAVKKFEKKLNIKQDGIAWPYVLKMLGLGGLGGIGGGDEPEYSDTSKVKLLLEAVQVSDSKEYYNVGDQITFKWTLTNKAASQNAMAVRTYLFRGYTPKKSTDTEIAQPETLIPGESFSEEYIYTVSKEDALAGHFIVGFISRCRFGSKNAESNTVIFVRSASAGIGGSAGAWTPPDDSPLTVTKKIISKPKNNTFYVKWEKIRYEITVTNKSADSVDGVIVTDSLFPSLDGDIGTLKAGKSKTFQAEYTVRPADIQGGEIVNTAIASWTGTDGKLKAVKATAKAPLGLSKTALYIYKTAVGTPANGLFYLPGETVTYQITVINTTKSTLTKVKIFDPLVSKPKVAVMEFDKLKSGESKTFTVSHKVTKLEAKLGKVTNRANAEFLNSKKEKSVAVSNVCTVPASLNYAGGLLIAKEIISTPENGRYYRDGEEIRYRIDVTNNTLKDITDMSIRDSLADPDSDGFRTIFKGEKLEAGKTASYTFSFTVSAGDVENTIVTNIASAWWTVDGSEYIETLSDPVYAPTAEGALARKVQAVRLEGDACENALTGTGEGTVLREITECSDHAETAEIAGNLLVIGDYEQAAVQWDGDIYGLYDEWMALADAQSRRDVEDELAAWEYQLSALQSSLSLVCDPETVDAVAVEERMNKCVELCGELHSAQGARSGIAVSEPAVPEQSGSSGGCRHSVSYEENGSAQLEDVLCDNHRLAAQLAEYLLAIAEDDDDRTGAWLQAQGIWTLELNNMYDTWYLASDDAARAKIAEDRFSFDRLIEARRKTLADLYPDDPAAAAEILANMIMNRTELICRLLHESGVLTD